MAKVTALPSQTKKNKQNKRNRKMLKRIDKCIGRIETQITKLMQVSHKLQSLKTTIQKQAA
jgi:division protein CdvB (Snf7/Vps24/ESCRT-III family)